MRHVFAVAIAVAVIAGLLAPAAAQDAPGLMPIEQLGQSIFIQATADRPSLQALPAGT